MMDVKSSSFMSYVEELIRTCDCAKDNPSLGVQNLQGADLQIRVAVRAVVLLAIAPPPLVSVVLILARSVVIAALPFLLAT